MPSPAPPPEQDRPGPGYYPQEAYYAPGWSASAQPAPARPRRGPGILLLVVVVAAVTVASGIALRTWADQRPLGEVSGTVSANVRQLTTGHCLRDLPADGRVDRVDVVPCSEPHAAEVVALHELADGPWPGRTAVDREATAACEMDTTQSDAGFRPVVWTPSEASWGQEDRTSLCLAWFEGGGVRGSWTDGDRVTTP
jgi:hypothetical protein